MAKNCNRDSDSEETTNSCHNTVFIDTNLDTHLALIVSDSDTVSDLKKKIISEHPQCFPRFGEIKIDAVKVKRKRCFYHLSESMFVKSAFVGAEKCWFVSVDAFSLKKHDDSQFPIEPTVTNQLALVCSTKTPSGDLYTSPPGIVNPEFALGSTSKDVLNDVEMTDTGVGEGPCNTSFIDANVRSDLGEIQGTHAEWRNEKSMIRTGGVPRNDSLEEAVHLNSGPDAKKKRKRESKGAGDPSDEKNILLSNFSEENFNPKDTILENSSEAKLKTATTTSDSLFTEPPDLVTSSSRGKKKKSKTKNELFSDQVVSHLNGVREESFIENIEIVAKNLDKASDVAIVAEENTQHAKLSGAFNVSQKLKHHEYVQEVLEQDKLPSFSADALCTEPPEGVHLVAGSRSEKKKSKKLKKLPTDEVHNAEPSSLHDVGNEGSKEPVSKDSDKAFDAVIVSEENVQHATLAETVEVSQKQSRPVQEGVEREDLPSSSVVAEPSEDVHLVAGSSIGRKKSKKKKKLPTDNTDQVADAEPSSPGKEGFMGNVEAMTNKEFDEAIVSEKNIQRPTLSGTFEVSKKQKHPEPVQEVLERDSLRPSSVEDLHLVDGSSSGKKKSKKRKKLRTDEALNAEASSLGKEGSKETVGTVSKDSDKASGEVIVSEQNVQLAALSGTFEVSQKQKHPERVQEVVDRDKLPSSPRGIIGSRPDIANENGEADAAEPGARSESKGRKTSKKKHHSTDVKEFPSLAVNELNNLKKDDTHSRHENTVPDNHNIETSRLPKNEEQRQSPQNHDPEAMLRDVETTSKTKKKTKSVKASSKTKLIQQELELETNHGSLNPQQTIKTVDSTQLPSSDTLVGNSVGRPFQNDEDGNASKHSTMTDANYEREVSKCNGDGVNFKDYFMRGEHKHEVMPVELVVDTVSEPKGSEREVKTKKNARKGVLTSPENSLNSFVKKGSVKRSNGVTKASDKKLGEVVGSSRHDKSLLATPGAIFRDGSSESSEEESGTVNSGSSTKTPSDNSSSSGFSEGDSKLNVVSPINGIHGAKEDGGKSIKKSQALSSKNVTLDTILRSSSRFKKAKFTASQPQPEDTESQPVDFVPDSQANL